MSEIKPKIYGQLVKVMGEVGAIGKDQRNQQQGFQYRGIDDVYNAVNPILAKHGVFMTSEVLEKSREERTTKNGGVLAFTCLRMKYTFWADDGSSVSTVVEGEGMDSGDKSSNKAMAVAHKYALLQAFCVPTRDMVDSDGEVHEIAPASRPAQAESKPVAQNNNSKELMDWATFRAEALKSCRDLDALDDAAEDTVKHENWKKLSDKLRQRLDAVKHECAAALTPNAAE